MKAFLAVMLILTGCREDNGWSTHSPEGAYQLEIGGAEEADSGTLEIIATDREYWGRLTLKRDEPFSVVVVSVTTTDNGLLCELVNGELRLNLQDGAYVGELVRSEDVSQVRARKEGHVKEDFAALARIPRFEAGLISTPANEAFPAFSPDGNTVYFSRYENWSHHTILMAEQTDGQWSQPQPVSFSGTYSDRAPFFVPDGGAMLFTSNRPPPQDPDRIPGRIYNLWMVDQDAAGAWKEPYMLPSPVSSDSSDYHGAVTRSGTIYFSSWLRPDGFGRSDLYRAVRSGSMYEVQNLGAPVNSPGSESDVYVDPEDRFIIFVGTEGPDAMGGDDLYISYRQDST